jgi:outer membrane protein assembly factor BamE (lipoprotein component of BamABCDE complex)
MTSHPALPTKLRWTFAGLLGLVIALSLSACAVPEWQKPGSSRAEIERALGRPTLVAPLEDGGERLVYSRQPAGQQVYHMDFDAQQRLVRVQQVLTAANFFTLRDGVDTKDSVYRQFGPPALVEKVASFKGDIWTYRILDNGLPRQANVHIDPAGVVRKVVLTDESLNGHDRAAR